jgi:hypothetical protein
MIGSTLLGRVWNITTTAEPSTWTVSATDTNITNGGAGVRQNRGGGNTNSGLVLSWDNYTVTDLTSASFGAYEIQRLDSLHDFQTIMLATNPAVTSFNDYEARVGVQSVYRIRARNAYDFVGSWSPAVSATIAEPGVTIGCGGGHVLIFTSNEQQDGSLNLAYSNAWQGEVQEAFSFPESSSVQLQAMYDRDFATAFHSPERGGERFERDILVQAAAINPPTLGDFRGLRDMAWADVSYICVRDEDANRWFATVLVPSGRVAHFRKIYIATIGIVEVTSTPSQVNP